MTTIQEENKPIQDFMHIFYMYIPDSVHGDALRVGGVAIASQICGSKKFKFRRPSTPILVKMRRKWILESGN